MESFGFVAEPYVNTLGWIRLWLADTFTIWSLFKTCQAKLTKHFAVVYNQWSTTSSEVPMDIYSSAEGTDTGQVKLLNMHLTKLNGVDANPATT
jgi:hypothetical protein